MTEEQSTPALSKDAEQVLEAVKKMSLMEVADLVKAMEKEFGVSAAAPVAMAMPTGGAAAGAEAEEKTSFDVELTSAGAQKIGVIKVVKDLAGLGLKEAKDIVDGAPKIVLAGAKKDVAEDAKKKLEAAGATVTLK
ncbi:MAG: 50S ribosomal protein L7/L12 [uncultured bacterium]|nr:MAG: 50S ribosomal protein L7/L12 [uncultured bacterium]OGJ48250.1 MAG: 50S ribosomal protein L7/L12 [Candidatus Peregrinibacteria bacterium RIFOXYA2_FULL_41_18]OGJ48805.1 MAG: 50S ribosomal protein L7/L12 [Candidatus Peregrinibacteria bacterium RIFOXYB12_FULL_41_12]OGJ52394.1 MAG: 50S ribosomal protein L7/L12 [Candidatus Peregrinibacteria bacterium RIFOXYB2_FULL_41_88]OGJ52860.1 MAG: 50S ribosomal protein L7/L12 [Candidatus Peregrinibacteria bacterium RIFOXYC2_FULL_41_22]